MGGTGLSTATAAVAAAAAEGAAEASKAAAGASDGKGIGHASPSRPASQSRLQAARTGLQAGAEAHLQVADGLPQLPFEHLEAAKMLGR